MSLETVASGKEYVMIYLVNDVEETAEDYINWGLEKDWKERKIFTLREIYEPRNR